MHITRVTLHPERYPTRERYPFNLETFHQTASIALTAPVVFFVGENGSGKSTLLRAICRRCGIHIWDGEEPCRVEVNPYEHLLYRAVEVQWVNGRVPGSFFGSDIFRHFAQILDHWASTDPGQLDYYGGRTLLTLSHGQSLLQFFRARYQRRGLYFLDEPETALSPKSQLELLALLQEKSAAGHAQFLIATHSPILLSCPGAQIWSFDHVPLRQIKYEETEHFQLYHRFMRERDALLGDR